MRVPWRIAIMRRMSDLPAHLFFFNLLQVEVQDESDPRTFPESFFTLDNTYFIRVKDRARSHEIEQIIRRLASEDYTKFQSLMLGLTSAVEKVRGQVFNLGTESGNYTKDEIVGLILKRLPETVIEYKDLTFGGDMRDITVSFEKIRRELGFDAKLSVDDGVRELVHALRTGMIRNPQDEKYRNAQFIVQ